MSAAPAEAIAGPEPVAVAARARPGPGDPPAGAVVLVSADMGAGHDAAAAELARGLAGQGFRVEHLNFLSVMPGPMHALIRETYRTMLRWVPWSYAALFEITNRSRFSVALVRAALRPLRRRMRRRLPPDTRVVVTTFPLANQLFGPMRRDRELAAPIASYVTDFAVHPVWISPGVDVYCVTHDAALEQAKTNGASDVRVVCPLVSDRFALLARLSRGAARRRFGLPAEGRLALIVAGSWGVGDVERTAAEVLATGCARPVVVCGRNEPLRRRLRRFPGHVLGWVDDMPSLMRAVDVVVENAGGLTCQESLRAGVPTVTYRTIPGHGRANAEILTRTGLTHYVASPERLRPTLAALLDGRTDRVAAEVSPIDMAAVVVEVERRATRRLGSWRAAGCPG